MRKLLIPLIITLLLMISNNTFAQTFSGGDGSADTPYLISSSQDLMDLSSYVNGNNTNNYNSKY